MVFATAATIQAPGSYRVYAARLPETDMLSVYVDRVKKLWADEGMPDVAGVLLLATGDLVESTGTLDLTRLDA